MTGMCCDIEGLHWQVGKPERRNFCGLAQSSERGVACYVYRPLAEKYSLKGAQDSRCTVFTVFVSYSNLFLHEAGASPHELASGVYQ